MNCLSISVPPRGPIRSLVFDKLEELFAGVVELTEENAFIDTSLCVFFPDSQIESMNKAHDIAVDFYKNSDFDHWAVRIMSANEVKFLA